MSTKKSRNKSAKQHRSNKNHQAVKSQSKGRNTPVKERGTVLTIFLVLIALHGILAGILYYTERMDNSTLDRPWILSLMVVHSLANVVAAVGIWYWKRWGLYVYSASTVLGVVVGLLAIGAWSLFYMILPLVILGWVLRTKWGNFEN
jgi:hypothetical protein